MGLSSEIIKLQGSLQYQADAIVSKVVLKKKTGNVTLFAFDEGQELSEHTAPFDALLHMLEGDADICINKVNHHLHTGEALVLPANIPHAVKASSRFKMMLTMIKS